MTAMGLCGEGLLTFGSQNPFWRKRHTQTHKHTHTQAAGILLRNPFYDYENMATHKSENLSLALISVSETVKAVFTFYEGYDRDEKLVNRLRRFFRNIFQLSQRELRNAISLFMPIKLLKQTRI